MNLLLEIKFEKQLFSTKNFKTFFCFKSKRN